MRKVWFITGAGSGSGARTARAAWQAGDRVVAIGRHLGRRQDGSGCTAGYRAMNDREAIKVMIEF